MKKPLIVNLYGAPSAGKSTGAAYIFSRLKLKRINAELVTEFVKGKVYEQSKGVFDNQVYIFGKQFFQMSKLYSDVDVIITDAPLMLQAYYGEKYNFFYHQELTNLVKRIADEENALNIFVERSKPYDPSGRFQTEQESDEIAKELRTFLEDNNIDFTTIYGDTEYYDSVVNEVCNMLWRDARAADEGGLLNH